MEWVVTRDSKSRAERHAGSIPVPRTITQIAICCCLLLSNLVLLPQRDKQIHTKG